MFLSDLDWTVRCGVIDALFSVWFWLPCLLHPSFFYGFFGCTAYACSKRWHRVSRLVASPHSAKAVY